MLTADIQNRIGSLLTGILRRNTQILSVKAAGGGCINECYTLNTNAGTFFLKINDPAKFPGMFQAEMDGLEAIGSAVPSFTPKVVAHAEESGLMVLVLEYIGPGKQTKESWRHFSERLASLHRNSRDAFGYDSDNYIGSLPQSNRKHGLWSDFFMAERLEPQVKRAVDSRALGTEVSRNLNRLQTRLQEIFPIEKPSLLHGDLWSGNYMLNATGEVCLIDPAVYYGFREMDLAMMMLFGGFPPSVLKDYEEFFPLEPGFHQRVDVCNLYPLLVHTNLFGGHYAVEARRILARF